jgi:N-acetyl-beta-hexosaminidase
MPKYKQVEYMAFPRFMALAEVVWLNDAGNAKSFEEFHQRLIRGHLSRLDVLKVKYRVPTPND